jgi:hypothetical protein
MSAEITKLKTMKSKASIAHPPDEAANAVFPRMSSRAIQAGVHQALD